MCFKIDWASLIVGSKFTVFALFYFVFEENFPSTSPRGAYIWRGDLTDGFFCYRLGGLIFGGAYFRNFTVVLFGWTFAFKVSTNRLFSSCSNPLFQSEAKCEAIDMKMFFCSHANGAYYHKKGFPVSLISNERLFGLTRKWPVGSRLW